MYGIVGSMTSVPKTKHLMMTQNNRRKGQVQNFGIVNGTRKPTRVIFTCKVNPVAGYNSCLNTSEQHYHVCNIAQHLKDGFTTSHTDL